MIANFYFISEPQHDADASAEESNNAAHDLQSKRSVKKRAGLLSRLFKSK